MRNVREVLRLRWSLGRSTRETAAAVGVSTGVIGKIAQRATTAGLDWAAVAALDDAVFEFSAGGETTQVASVQWFRDFIASLPPAVTLGRLDPPPVDLPTDPKAIAQQALTRDLQVAREMQTALLPKAAPDVGGYHFFQHYQAAYEVGGDYYDYVLLPEDRFAAVVGDVAGKGPEAAGVTAQARDTMRTAAAYEVGPGAVLARLNAALGQDDTARLCTAVAVLLAPVAEGEPLRATIACAGNPRPHLVSEGASRLVGEYGTLLGAFDEGDWPEVTVALEEGESLVLYTDGIVEACDPDDEEFGLERLEALLSAHRAAPLAELAAEIDRALEAFVRGVPLRRPTVSRSRTGRFAMRAPRPSGWGEDM